MDTSKWQMDETQGYTLQELHRNFILSDHDLHAEERRQLQDLGMN